MAVVWGNCNACDLRFYVVGPEEDAALQCPTCRQPAESKTGLFPVWSEICQHAPSPAEGHP